MTNLLQFTESGIYCEQANVFIDPWRPVKNAFITHGHSDHARWGHEKYLCHQDSVSILKHRLGDVQISGIEYGKQIKVNGVNFSFHPAGHIIGSAQIRVEYKGEVWVASGDYKTEDDGISTAFEPVKCHTFITECTFGLPVYNWEKDQLIFDSINDWWRQNKQAGKVSIISAYSLGKAQRVLNNLDTSTGSIYTHGAIENMNEVLRKDGLNLQPTIRVDQTIKKDEFSGSIVICPPTAIGSAWAKKLGPQSAAMASGWMGLRGSKRRRNVDRGFVLSDHADWKGLNRAIKETGAENVITTHGYTGTFSKWLREQGLNAMEEKTLFEGESIDSDDIETKTTI
ncbi:MAG: ligase-associated DNA damage response exonuclease [Bacteroidota bacterium]